MEDFIETCEKKEEIKFIINKIFELSIVYLKEQMDRLNKGIKKDTFEFTEYFLAENELKKFNKTELDDWLSCFMNNFSYNYELDEKLKSNTHTNNKKLIDEIFVIEMQHYINISNKRTIEYKNANILFSVFIRCILKDFKKKIVENIKKYIESM